MVGLRGLPIDSIPLLKETSVPLKKSVYAEQLQEIHKKKTIINVLQDLLNWYPCEKIYHINTGKTDWNFVWSQLLCDYSRTDRCLANA